MTSLRERSRNNVRAGIFVTVTLILGFAILIALTDLWAILTTSSRTHIARFSVTGGVSRIERGSKVFVGGVPMGSVERIDPRIVEGGPFREIDVVFKLDEAPDLAVAIDLDDDPGGGILRGRRRGAGAGQESQGRDERAEMAEAGHGSIVRSARGRGQRPVLPQAAGSAKLAPGNPAPCMFRSTTVGGFT